MKYDSKQCNIKFKIDNKISAVLKFRYSIMVVAAAALQQGAITWQMAPQLTL